MHGGIAQTFATVPGQRYRVTFDLAGNPNRAPIMKPMRITAAGQSADFTFDATGKSGRDMGWLPTASVFSAVADSTTLEFTCLTVSPQTGYGAAIDRVAVVPLDDGPLRVTEKEAEIRLSLERAEAVKRWLVANGSRRSRARRSRGEPRRPTPLLPGEHLA